MLKSKDLEDDGESQLVIEIINKFPFDKRDMQTDLHKYEY